MPRILYATKDLAEAQLDANITAGSTSLVLNAGEGAEFPQPYTGTCSSTGSSTTLNDTGDLANLAVGDFIRNVTDGSWAYVTVAGTNSVTTTKLRGGTLNVWTSGDEWQVNEFVVTLEARDASTPPEVTKREKVLIKNRSTDTLTVRTRGYDSSTAQSFDADDYVNLHVVSVHLEHLIDTLYDVTVRTSTDETDIDNIESGAAFYVAAAGSSNAYTGTLSPAPTAYAAGQHYVFKANHQNTGAATINFNSLGAKTIKKHNDQDLASGDIENGQIVEVVYDSTNMQLVSGLGNAPATATQINLGTVTTASASVGASSTSENAMAPTWTGSNDVGSGKLTAAGAYVVGHLGGNYRLDSGSLSLKLTLGATVLGQLTMETADTASRAFFLPFRIVARSVGGSGSLIASGVGTFSNSTSDKTWTLSGNGVNTPPTAQTIDTTAAQALTLTATFSASDADHFCNIQDGALTIQLAPV